jgi:hypothetical protein
LRFPVLGVGRSCAKLVMVGVYTYVGGVVVRLSAWMDNVVLPPGSLLMVAALRGVGENWMVRSWWGHGLDAVGTRGGRHSWHVHPSVNMGCAVGG